MAVLNALPASTRPLSTTTPDQLIDDQSTLATGTSAATATPTMTTPQPTAVPTGSATATNALGESQETGATAEVAPDVGADRLPQQLAFTGGRHTGPLAWVGALLVILGTLLLTLAAVRPRS